MAIFSFCLAKSEISQKVANWRLLSCQLATFQLKTQIWPAKILQILIKVANWQIKSSQLATFELFQFWLDKSKKSIFDIIWKYLIRCCYWSKTNIWLFWSLAQKPLGILKFKCPIEFFEQFLIRCVIYFSIRFWLFWDRAQNMFIFW